jgi:cell division protease FtsH
MNNRPFQRQGGEGPSQHPSSSLGCSNWSSVFWLLLLGSLALWIWGIWGNGAATATSISYSAFRQQLREGNVEEILIEGDQIQGTLAEAATKEVPEGENVEYTQFVTYLPSFGDDELLALLEEQNVTVETRPESDVSWWALVLNFLPLLLLLGAGFYLFSRMRSGGGGISSVFSMRESGAKLYERSDEGTTFDDVAGLGGPKTELQEVIEFLKNPSYFQRLGGEVPKGVLLVGPPGTGKTLLARAVAGEADVPFFSITGSNFMEMLVGVGASRVRDLFTEAKKAAPSIIFIDELDSIGRRRGAGLGGGHDEREQTLNQLLSEMDGFEPNESVIVIAATNRPDILDRALLRPGRFDRQITVNLPTLQDRIDILKIHSQDKPLASDVDLERMARGTPGFSGADLENLLNEAALLAARRDRQEIENEDVEDARDKVMMGLEREGISLAEDELELLAYHEGGHAIVAAVLPHADPIHKVTIVPRGQAMGVTQQLPERDRYIYRQEYMLDRLAVMMGGRVAEHMVFGTATSGAENDLKQATQLARKMVLDWGMSERLGHIAYGGRSDQVFLGQEIAQRREYSETTAREIDEEIKDILSQAYQRAWDTLKEYREHLDRLVEALVAKEEIVGEAVVALVQGEPSELFGEDGRPQEENEEKAEEPV